MKIINYMFLGEGSRELKNLDPKERRSIFFKAVKTSYKRPMTWFGFLAFIAIVPNSEKIANAIYFILDKNLFSERTVQHISPIVTLFAFFILYKMQMFEVIKDIKKTRKS
ncbi:hypothetical protein ACFLS1_11505 [Verrucomicrobiota bacterium]